MAASDAHDRGVGRYRWAAMLIGGGLAVQGLSLLGTGPGVFLTCLLVGCPLVLLGMALFLHTTLRR